MTTAGVKWIHLVIALAASPFLLGVIQKTKALFAGRWGQPLSQPYRDLAKLLRKGSVISRTTTWIFKAGPVVGLAAAGAALTLVPFGGGQSLFHFSGDLILFAYALAVMRFFTVLAALDTGSSFEGMGASREVLFSALAEPALILGLVAAARESGSLSLSGMLSGAFRFQPEIALVAVAFTAVFLCENARIPFDDPNTHLELTMIHEVMVLDHGGPDLAFILYGSALKLWVLGSLIVGLLVPFAPAGPWWINTLLGIAGMIVLAAAVGVIESVTARLRLNRVPQVLAAAAALSALALVLSLR
jgi:formate hydrogenlyase subunit 4